MSRGKSEAFSHDGLEPQVTSTEPNERKLARRLRIERRQEATKRTKSKAFLNLDDKSTYDADEPNEIQIQLKNSAELLEKFLLEGEEYITNVRVANDSREVDRREAEGINKEKIYEQLDEEAQSAVELFNNITNKWSTIQRQNDPLHINEAIMDQKEKCDMLISQKDAIIAMLNDELKNAEKQFTKDQKKQIEDINTLSERIEKQISFMRKAFREELSMLEWVISEERLNLIDVTDKKWDELYKKRENQEISNSDTKAAQVEDFNYRMDALKINFQEHYRETKIKLENDIEELQRELEKIKALALLNSEKLDYNYQILKKREDENIIIKSQQKRRMNKLQDVINDLRGQISDYETSMSNKIKKLSDNIRKLHKSIVDVEAKADHFAHVNDQKFHMLWEMNKSRVLGVLRKILETDRILYEQQMGLDWERPLNHLIDKKTLPSYKLALNNVPAEFIYDVVDHRITNISKKSIVSLATSPAFLENGRVDDAENSNYRAVIKHILTRISDKSGFLAEKRLKVLLKGYVDDQKHLVRLDNVFAALGIQGSTYINVLFKHFEPYTYCPVCQGSMVIESSATGSRATSGSGSRMSSFFSRVEDSSAFMIPELDDVIGAIRQPDEVLTAIIEDLVSTDDLAAGTSISSPSEHEDIEDICGVMRDTDQKRNADGAQKYKNVNQCITINAYFGTRHFISYLKLDNVKNNILDRANIKIKRTSMRKRLSIQQAIWGCQYNHPLVISPVYVLRALREFVSSYYVRKVGQPTTGARLERRRMTISRYLSEYDIKVYWEKIKLNFAEDRVRVWDALLEGLKKYHEILKDRKTICDDVMKLRRENAELKRLLANYLDHHEFMPPSCAKDKYLP